MSDSALIHGGKLWQDVASLVELASLLSREPASFPSGGFVRLFFFFFFSSTSLLLPTHLPPPLCTRAQSCNPMDCSPPGSSVHGIEGDTLKTHFGAKESLAESKGKSPGDCDLSN